MCKQLVAFAALAWTCAGYLPDALAEGNQRQFDYANLAGRLPTLVKRYIRPRGIALGDEARMSKAQRRERYYQAYGEIRATPLRDFQFGATLKGKNGNFGDTTQIEVRLTPTTVELKQRLHLVFDSSIGRRQRSEFKARLENAITAHLDQRLELVSEIRPNSSRRRLRLGVEFVDDVAQFADAEKKSQATIRVVRGSGRANTGKLFLNSTDGTLAHEMAHRMLNADDEYFDTESLRKASGRNYRQRNFQDTLGYDPGSLMRSSSKTPTLLSSHAATIGRLIGNVAGEKMAVSLAPEFRFAKRPPPIDKQIMRAEMKYLDAAVKQIERAGWSGGQERSMYGPKNVFVGFREGLIKYLGHRRLLKKFGDTEEVRRVEPTLSGEYCLVSVVATMVGEETFVRLIDAHGRGAIDKFEDLLASRITDEGREALRRERVTEPLKHVLNEMDGFFRPTRQHKELVFFFGKLPTSDAMAARLAENTRRLRIRPF